MKEIPFDALAYIGDQFGVNRDYDYAQFGEIELSYRGGAGGQVYLVNVVYYRIAEPGQLPKVQ